MHAVAERAGLCLHDGEELALCRALDAEHVFHHEDARSKGGDVIEEGAEQIAALVAADARAVVGGIDLPHIAVALAGWPADDHVHGVHAEFLREFSRV